MDLLIVLVSAPFILPLVVLAWLTARMDTGSSGFYRQDRVGESGTVFRVVKIRTMREGSEASGPVTVRDDARVTTAGRILRRWKLDELPQFWNVLKGDMTLVGPRPDVPGFADRLEGRDRVILDARPGITSPATLAFRDEERLLADVEDPEGFNARVLFPAKVEMNRRYLETRSFLGDLRLIVETLIPPLGRRHVREGRRLLARFRNASR